MRLQDLLINDINSSNGHAAVVVVRLNKEDDDKCFSFFCNERPFTNIFKAMGYCVDDGEIVFSYSSNAEAHALLSQVYSYLSIPDAEYKAANCKIVMRRIKK